MKAISETVSTMIIFSIIVVVIILIFMTSLTLLSFTTQTAEYGYVKTVFINLANSLPDLLEGGSYGAQLPSKIIGLGYMKLNNTFFSIKIINDEVYRDQPVIIYGNSTRPIVTFNRTLFGRNENKSVVNETIVLGRVYEEYYEGSGTSYIKLDTARACVKTYLYRVGTISRYIVNILYVKIEPILLTSRPSKLSVSLSNVNQITRLVDLSSISQQVVLEIRVSGREPYILTKASFVEASSVLFNIRIVTLRVVYM